MKLTLNSIGKGKLKPDEIKVNITMKIVDKKKRNRCVSNLINIIGSVTEKLNEKDYINEVIFDSYRVSEQTKMVKYKEKKEEHTEFVFDHWLGIGYLNFSMPLDFKYVEEIQNICDNFLYDEENTHGVSVLVSVDFSYGLSEQSENNIQTMAINSALDKMLEQAEKIKNHLRKNSVELKEINFEETSSGFFGAPRMAKAVNYETSISEKEFSIGELDKILNLKDITKSISVTSEWEIE